MCSEGTTILEWVAIFNITGALALGYVFYKFANGFVRGNG